MTVVHRDLDGNVTTRPYTPQEIAERNAAAAAERAAQAQRRQAERDLDTAPAVVRDIMLALVEAGLLTEPQARAAYSTVVQRRQGGGTP